jgi:lauroyl/myristoyl acyltransferase
MLGFRQRRGNDVAVSHRLRFPGDVGLRALASLPKRWAYPVAAARGRHRYRRARETLNGRHAAILGECLAATPAQLQRWAELEYEHASCDELEWLLLTDVDRDNLAGYLAVRGRDRLEDALRQGKGAILYSAHLRGQYQFFAALGLLGFKPNIVGTTRSLPGTSARRHRLWERRDAILRDMGCRFLYMVDETLVAVRAVNALRRNEVVAFVIDHSFSGHHVDVEFMGRPASLPVGPLLVAESTRAPLLPYWIHRPPGRRPQVAEIGEPIELSDHIAETLRRLVAPLEENVRRYPDSWTTWLFSDAHLWSEES